MLNSMRKLIEARFPRILAATRLLRGVPYLQVESGKYPAWLEYPVDCQARWGHGKPSHSKLAEIIAAGRSRYTQNLESFNALSSELQKIPAVFGGLPGDTTPFWTNGWLPDLDGIAIYAWLALQERHQYVEVGSGNSTKFARLAIKNHNRQTRIVSIDPQPRAEIDSLCDEVVRSRLENIDLTMFERLEAGDVLFIDNSHYAFMGSDVTVVFFEILPRLKPGVLVGLHDIFLPDDYLPAWKARFYNEQYLFGCWLLGGGRSLEIVLPAWFVTRDEQLSQQLAPLYSAGGLKGIQPFGCAMWFVVT